jgi:hypothetical protein
MPTTFKGNHWCYDGRDPKNTLAAGVGLMNLGHFSWQKQPVERHVDSSGFLSKPKHPQGNYLVYRRTHSNCESCNWDAQARAPLDCDEDQLSTGYIDTLQLKTIKPLNTQVHLHRNKDIYMGWIEYDESSIYAKNTGYFIVGALNSSKTAMVGIFSSGLADSQNGVFIFTLMPDLFIPTFVEDPEKSFYAAGIAYPYASGFRPDKTFPWNGPHPFIAKHDWDMDPKVSSWLQDFAIYPKRIRGPIHPSHTVSFLS